MKKLILLLIAFVASIEIIQAGVQGALPSAFSVSATKKVYFSQGNLQYQASTKTWRFAANQYDFIGSGNQNISSTYSGWIDLFGYGTSGWNSGATYYLPTSTSTTATGYLAKDLSGSYANADWGIYNAISNGGNKTKTWRTLTYTEWNYIFITRANATNLYSVGTVNSKPGLILLPDGWVLPSELSFTPKAGSYSTNTYSTTQWTKMANAGAVFLPAAGWRALKEYRDTSSGGSGKRGCYQTASYYSSSTNEYSYFVNFYSNSGPSVVNGLRSSGLSVRLVVDVPTYTITWKNWDGTTLATTSVLEGATPSYTGSTPTRPSTAEYAYTFSGWTPAITAATADKTYTATYTQTVRKYNITFVNAEGTQIGSVQKIEYGNDATPPTPPSRSGYTFVGWIGKYTNVQADAKVYASYYHNHLPSTPHGALDGWFPISDSTEVQFAQGNLQYNAVVGTHMCADASSKLGVWRFGELQYDTISYVNNKYGSATYKNWIDQFGFGTSGWQSDATAYQPYAQSTNNANYIQHSLTDAYVYADWGVYNSIFNGGNTPELWRTPTYQELDYLIAHAKEENRIGVACIEHTYAGLVLLPSQFVLPAGLTFNAQMRVEEIDIVEAFDNINSYTASQWAKLENNGAIFLQFQEPKVRPSSEPLNWLLYMSSTERDANTNYVISCDGGRSISVNGKNKNKYEGFSIRLVSAKKRMRQYLITLTSTDNIKGTATGGGTYDYGTNHQITATPNECYRFVQWSDGNTENPRTITVSGDATYTAEFEQIQYTIEAQSADAGQGSATVTNP